MLQEISEACKENLLARIATNPNDYAQKYIRMLQCEGAGHLLVIYARELTNPALLEQIGVPWNHTIVAPIIIGFPAIAPAPQKRKTATTLKLKI